MSGGPTYILHEMMSVFFSWPLTNISSVIHMLCRNRFHKDHACKFLGPWGNWPQPQNSDISIGIQMFLFFFFSQHTYITILIKFSGAFTCLCFPPSSCIRSFKGTYHSSPGSFLGLSDFQSSRKSCLCWKVLYFTSKLFSSGQTSWLNKWVLSKVIFFVCLRS